MLNPNFQISPDGTVRRIKTEDFKTKSMFGQKKFRRNNGYK